MAFIGNRKEWAREHMAGVENCTFPSFTSEMADLDEEGIRHDVRQAIAHGFFSTMCSTETGLSFDEAKRFVEIVADEAGDKISVSTSILFDTMDQNREFLVHAEQVGASTALLGYAPSYYPRDEAEIEKVTREMAELTNLGIVLYPSPHYNFGRLHPSGFNPQLIERLADIDNVVAIKVGEPGLAAESQRRAGDKILVNCPVERWLPLTWQSFRQQWIGAGCYEVFQSPEKPYLVQYFDLLRQDRWDEAMEIYWELTPLRAMFEQQFNQTVMLGTYHWPLQKFYQYLSGGNGGYTRQPTMKLHQWDMDPLRVTMGMVGLDPETDDEPFYYGRANWERMHHETAGAAATPPRVDGDGASAVQSATKTAGHETTVSDLTLVDAADVPVPLLNFQGRFSVLCVGGQKAQSQLEDWQRQLRAALIGDTPVVQVALLSGLPTFVPKGMIKKSFKDDPSTLLDWDGDAERALSVATPDQANAYVIDPNLEVVAHYTGACDPAAIAEVVARVVA